MVLHPQRPGYAVGIPDGWQQCLAARLPDRQARGLSFGQRRQVLAAYRRPVADGAGVGYTVKRQAMAADDAADPVGVYFGDHQRRSVGRVATKAAPGNASPRTLPSASTLSRSSVQQFECACSYPGPLRSYTA